MKKFLLIISLFLTASVFMAQERSFEWYGYGQLDFVTSDQKNSVSTFDQRRINLIGEFFLDDRIRVLSDFEYEGGADISSNHGVGTIKISRGWIEYTVKPYFKLRAGKILTPFGLYNLNHDASASYYSVDPPLMYSELKVFPGLISQRLYAKYFIGIEATGIFDLDNDGSQLEYFAGIGNGRGSNADGTDINPNKAVLGRVMFRPAFLYGLQLGTSVYFDKNFFGIGGIPNDAEQSYGFDVQFEDSYMQIQSELMLARFGNPDYKKQTAAIYYGQAAYTFFQQLTPFVNYTIVWFNTKHTEDGFHRFNFGLNWAVSPRLFLKGEIQFHTRDEEVEVEESFNVLKISAAVAF